jgi:hypothetical protein
VNYTHPPKREVVLNKARRAVRASISAAGRRSCGRLGIPPNVLARGEASCATKRLHAAELMIVVAIIAILAAIALPSYRITSLAAIPGGDLGLSTCA